MPTASPRAMFRRLAAPGILSALLLTVCWPHQDYQQREATQVASIRRMQGDALARVAGSVGDIPLAQQSVIAGPVIGRPVIDMIRAMMEPQSAAAQRMMGVQYPDILYDLNLSATRATPRAGALYPIRKLLEGMVFAMMIPALMISLAINMLKHEMNFLTAGLKALKPWGIAVFALLAYPLLDMAVYWGIGRPLAVQLSGPGIKYGLIQGMMNSGVPDDRFSKWANEKILAERALPGANRANAAGGVSIGMSLSITCAKALSRYSNIEDMFKPTDENTPYEMKECRSPAVPIESRLLMMRNIMAMAPVSDATEGEGAAMMAEVGRLIKLNPEMMFEIFSNTPNETAWRAAARDVQNQENGGSTWYGKIWFAIKDFVVNNALTNLLSSMRNLSDVLESTVAGVLTAIVTMVTTLLLAILVFEAEMARAFSLALAPIAIGWALFESGNSKLFGWAKGHIAASLRVAGAELVALLVMTIVLGFALFPLRGGLFGINMMGACMIMAVIMLFTAKKQLSVALAGDIAAGAKALAEGSIKAIGRTAAVAGAFAIGGPMAAKVGAKVGGRFAGSRAGEVVGRATRVAAGVNQRMKTGRARMGEGAAGDKTPAIERLKNMAELSLKTTRDRARQRNAELGGSGAALADSNARYQGTMAKMNRNLRDREVLAGANLNISSGTITLADGKILAPTTAQEAMSAKTATAVAREVGETMADRVAEGMRFATNGERAAGVRMTAMLKQALLAEAVDNGGSRAAVVGDFGEDANGNRTIQVGAEGMATLLRAIKHGGLPFEQSLREAAFDGGMSDALSAPLEDVLKRSAAAQAAIALLAEEDVRLKEARIDQVLMLDTAKIDIDSPFGAAMLASKSLARREGESDEAFHDRIEATVRDAQRRIQVVMDAEAAGEPIDDETIVSAARNAAIRLSPALTDSNADDDTRQKVVAAHHRAQTAAAREVAFWSTAQAANLGMNVAAWERNGLVGLEATAAAGSLYEQALDEVLRAHDISPAKWADTSTERREAFAVQAFHEAVAKAITTAQGLPGEDPSAAAKRLGLVSADGKLQTKAIREAFAASAGELNRAIWFEPEAGGLGAGNDAVTVVLRGTISGAVGRTDVRQVTQFADGFSQALEGAMQRGSFQGEEAVLRALPPIIEGLQRQVAAAAAEAGMPIESFRATLPQAVDFEAVASLEPAAAAEAIAESMGGLQSVLGRSHPLYQAVNTLRREMSLAVARRTS